MEVDARCIYMCVLYVFWGWDDRIMKVYGYGCVCVCVYVCVGVLGGCVGVYVYEGMCVCGAYISI